MASDTFRLSGPEEKLKKTVSRLVWTCVVLVILSMEWLEYALLAVSWPKFPSGLKDSVRILIVSDPQLLGHSFSAQGTMGYICRWDADKFVSKTFSQAHRYVVPDVVLFLGDNLDEGEIASDAEFSQYVRRFQYVFREVDFRKAIVIPGDNDIGGEDEPPSPHLEQRFDKYFRKDVFIPYRFLEFVKVNYISHSNEYLSAPNTTAERAVRIALSHIPLTSIYSTFIGRVIPYLKPHIILSAHDHKSSHWIAQRLTGFSTTMVPQLDLDSFVFNISDTYVHEIMVPTCSYRMGTHKMGYGALEISPSGEAFYAVLWLPSRFRQLYVYLACVACLGVCLLLSLSRVCCRFVWGRNASDYHKHTNSHAL